MSLKKIGEYISEQYWKKQYIVLRRLYVEI
jgi:hypothetical protein